jgi:hypothetical protein
MGGYENGTLHNRSFICYDSYIAKRRFLYRYAVKKIEQMSADATHTCPAHNPCPSGVFNYQGHTGTSPVAAACFVAVPNEAWQIERELDPKNEEHQGHWK